MLEEISIILREEIIATFVEGQTDLTIQFINGQKFRLQVYEVAKGRFFLRQNSTKVFKNGQKQTGEKGRKLLKNKGKSDII